MFAMAPSSAGAIAFLFVAFVVVVFVVAYWRVFVKAGEPGWGAVVPLYNMYLYCKIAGRPEWWLILLFVPLVNIVFALILAMDIAKAFAQDAGLRHRPVAVQLHLRAHPRLRSGAVHASRERARLARTRRRAPATPGPSDPPQASSPSARIP